MNKPINFPFKKYSNRSHITRQVLIQYILALIGFVIAYIIFFLLAWKIARHFVWYADNPLYWILKWVSEYILLVTGVICLLGWAFITYHFMSRPLRYLDDIIAASEQLARPEPEPIRLPHVLKNIQDELNLIREQALRNALLAKEAEQRKNDLIVYLAHDLKTPLTSVIGYLTLLSDEPQISSDLRARYTKIALTKAERLEELINEFFDITRFNLTTLTLETERVSLSRMLEQIASEFHPILKEKELTWDLKIEPDVEILCDPDKLERVFDNLLRNAVNYSYAGTAIHLSLERLPGQADCGAADPSSLHNGPDSGQDAPASDKSGALSSGVCVRVKNSGRTIAPEKLEHIFEQFYRLDSSRSSSTGGAGLGLAIAREITELHGGTIRAESEQESITFTVLLPGQ